MPKLTAEQWVDLMRPIAQAARNWRENYPSRAKAELELARAVDAALARADARPVEEQLAEAEEMVLRWTARVEALRKMR